MSAMHDLTFRRLQSLAAAAEMSALKYRAMNRHKLAQTFAKKAAQYRKMLTQLTK